ncbi:UNVERIFIED_CONTAM: hypothetical protein Scaly_2038600 [Sesamum calycinum]|uniref:DUF4216 domain-containing protein n=1 Tax=Sesamum calycinum TaxID=2727403 RepID=A0AAW2N1L7_9LAMI
MYPFERFFRNLKMKVKNKSHVEASNVEAYVVEEIDLFTSQYFESQSLCKRNKPSRNDDLSMNDPRNKLLKLHYCGPTAEVTTFQCYFVNGYNFHTKHHSVDKSTFNYRIILFKCRWVDAVRGMKVHPRYHLVDVNFKKVYQKNEPFILAQQAVQVYYIEYPNMKRDKVDWIAVCKIKARRVIDDSRWTEVAFQEDETIHAPQVVMDDHIMNCMT